MTSDRLELVKDLLVRISEIPEAERDSFLDRICSDDPGLREEIDSLLRYEATARALQMSSEGARVGPHPADPLGFVGRVVSHYRVVEMIGSGGMGVVYKAEDSKLRRTVALKFLPPHLMLDDRANQRFMQEAHAASALDHPNICTIFDIDRTDDGQLFIAMAHYDGTSVERLIANGPVPLGDVADVGVQVLRGLQAAHEAGIIHRDIKPANLIVSQRGLVKILDFGLAKLRGESGLTRAGAKIGTVSYMSPERLQGHEATAGSDIWAVGVSLYEMLTGRLPFPGEEAAAAYSAENREPERIRSLRPEAPKLLEAVVLRAVEKRPEERYSSAEEFLWHLLPLRDAESRGSGQDLRPSLTKMPRGLSRNRWIGQRRRGALVPIIGACVLVGSFGLLHRLQDRDTLPTFANPTRITVDMGVELFASWSPDGRSLAYQSSRSGDVDVWVAQIGLGEVNRTGDHDGYDGRPSWSPDGSQIAFVSQRDGGGTFVMPAIGGSSRKVSEVWGSMFTVPQWSPDGAEIASVPSDTSRAIEIVDVRTNEVQWLEMPAEQGLMSYQLSWSPSGRFFAYVNVPNLGSSNSRIWILRADGTEGHPVTEPGSYDWCPSWSADERTLYFLSDRGGSRELWRLPLDTNGRPRAPPGF